MCTICVSLLAMNKAFHEAALFFFIYHIGKNGSPQGGLDFSVCNLACAAHSCQLSIKWNFFPSDWHEALRKFLTPATCQSRPFLAILVIPWNRISPKQTYFKHILIPIIISNFFRFGTQRRKKNFSSHGDHGGRSV